MSEEQPFYIYRVLETENMTAEELQHHLNSLLNGEFQINCAAGTKLILQTESNLNRTGSLEARLASTRAVWDKKGPTISRKPVDDLRGFQKALGNAMKEGAIT